MKGAVILLCAFAVVLGNDIKIDIELNEVGCPVNPLIEKTLPHTYCNMFNQCSNGRILELRCSGNLMFNLKTFECDYRYNVDCAGRNMSESKPETTTVKEIVEDDICNDDPAEASAICTQSGSDGVLVAHDYCNRFFKCASGYPVALRCPGKLRFNPCKNQCDYAENVNCGNRTIPEGDDDDTGNNGGGEEEDDDTEPGNDDPSKAPEICAEPDSDGILVAHEYCNWFYNCWDGLPSAQKCPVSLVFSPPRRRCDFPANVDCGNKTISEPEVSENTTKPEDDEENDRPINDDPAEAKEICARSQSDGVLVAHENCNSFYNCFNGEPISQRCPTKLHYNPLKEQCDHRQNVDCGNRTISEDNDDDNNEEEEVEIDRPVYDNPAEAPEICARNDTDGALVAHENCDQFYICNLYIPVALKCGSGLHFNPITWRCDWPANVNCGDRIIPVRNETKDENEETCNNCDPSEAPTICAREGSNGVLVAHEYCNKYYKCYAGKPNVLNCINTYMFSPIKGWCVRPEEIDCGDRIIPDNDDSGNSNPSEAADICARAGSEGVLVAHKVCSQFYKCSHGKPVELECQTGLQYNPLLEICDWPRNIDCGDREQ